MLPKNKIQAQQPQVPRVTVFSLIRNYSPISKAHIPGILSVLFLGTILSACSLPKRRTGEIFLIPKGYTGKVYIFYDQPSGQQEEWTNRNRVFRIGKNGKLYVKDKQYFRPFDSDSVRYYYVDSSGNRTKIQYCWPEDRDKYNKNEIMVFDRVNGNCSHYDKSGSKLYYDEFTINTLNTLNAGKSDPCEEFLNH